MENKTLKLALTGMLAVSLIGNMALFWQLNEEQDINAYKVEEVAKKASERAKKNSSKADDEISELKETIKEKDQTINQLQQRDGTESVNQVTEVQKDKAEEFAKIAIDKSIRSNEISEKLKDVATQEVIDKLIPADDHQQDEYGSYSFTLGDSKTYSESATSSEEQKLVVFIDYTVGNPQFKDVKPQKIKGGVTVTEKLIDGQWKVADFEFFTR
ncbi:hypothetical protein ACFC3Z_12155 [Enterococcus thailandicus]|uniref:hypothetical protein n=1 Tax=Enterococcus thailandicus TaxID=417368 RepID=UPI0035DE0DCA